VKRFLVLPALIATLACGRHKDAESSAPPPTAKVRLAEAGQGQGSGWIAATLTATRRATLSTRLAAQVRKVHVNEGQTVAAGALLVSLADDDLQGGLKAAEAAVAAAEAQHRRMANLIRQDAAVQAEVDLARTQLAQAQAALAQARANLAYTRIRAPFAGVVQARLVNDGAFAGPGTPLLELEGRGDLELDGSVSEAEAKGLKIGARVPFEADGRTGLAEITALAAGGDPVSHRGALRARIVKGGENLRTGTFARIQLPGAPRTGAGPSVPRSALVARGELTGVFVARDGRAELHWLSLGEPQGDRVPVRAGLAPGLGVIDRPEGLADGQPIEVVK
jgi:RND family efflux transporter MFP subunit